MLTNVLYQKLLRGNLQETKALERGLIVRTNPRQHQRKAQNKPAFGPFDA